MQPRRILARAFDFDGMFFSCPFYESAELHGDVLKCHPEFFAFLNRSAQEKNYAERYSFIGSTRQSLFIDMMNKFNKDEACRDDGLPGCGHSCFAHIEKIAAAWGSAFHPLLLTDICHKKPSGTSYKMIQESELSYVQQPTVFGEFTEKLQWDKTSIVFAHIHQLALEHPNDIIDYEFFDDNEGVLATLYHYFKVNPSRIPKNVNLTFYQYYNHDANERILRKCPPLRNEKAYALPSAEYADLLRTDHIQAAKRMSHLVDTKPIDIFVPKINVSAGGSQLFTAHPLVAADIPEAEKNFKNSNI